MPMSAVCHSIVLTSPWPVVEEDVVAWGERRRLWTNSLVFLFRRDFSVRTWQMPSRQGLKQPGCVGQTSSALLGADQLYHCCVYYSFFALLFPSPSFFFVLYKYAKPSWSGCSSWNWFLQTATQCYPRSLLQYILMLEVIVSLAPNDSFSLLW